MADNNRIGGIHVDISANTAPLQAGLKQAEAETQKTAAKLNESLSAVGRGGAFDGVAKGIKDSTAGVRNLLSAVVGVVGAFTRMLGIIGLVVSAVTALGYGAKKVYDHFAGTADEAERVQKNLEDAAKAYERYVDRVAAAAKNIKSPVPNISAEDTKKLAEIEKEISRLANGEAFKANPNGDMFITVRERLARLEGERDQILSARKRAAEIERQSEAKEAEEAAAKEAALEDKAQQDILAAIRKAREQRMAERKKEIDDLAEYQLQTALMVINRQKELDKERADDLIKNAKAVQSAFDAVLKSQRGAMDSNKLAIDIGRLAAAVEDMARSPRGPGMVMGGGW